MNPASIMKMMKAKNTFTANHPKFVSFLQYAFGSGIPAEAMIWSRELPLQAVI